MKENPIIQKIQPYRIKYDGRGSAIIPNIWRRCNTLKEYWWYIIYIKNAKYQKAIPFEFSKRKLARFFYTDRLKEHPSFKFVSYKYLMKHKIPLMTVQEWTKTKRVERIRPKLVVVDSSSEFETKKYRRRHHNQTVTSRRYYGDRERYYKVRDNTSTTSPLYQNEVKDIMQGIMPLTMINRKY